MVKIIIPPVNPNDTGDKVRNLQEALHLLLEKKIIASFQLPDRPTEGELSQLRDILTTEEAAAQFGSGTRQLLSFFQMQQGFGDSLGGVVEETTSARINAILTELEVLDDPENNFIVKGIISQFNGEVYPYALVRAYDHDLRRAEFLGESITNKAGYYEIKYRRKIFTNAEKGNADLSISVYKNASSENGNVLLTSDIYYNAQKVKEINLVLPPLPEWERINEIVLPLLREQGKSNIAEPNVAHDLLPQELESSDIDFISNETGFTSEQLRFWSLAFSFAYDPFWQQFYPHAEIPSPVIFYAWFRMGFPASLQDLQAKSVEELLNVLTEAAKHNIIPDLAVEEDMQLVSSRIGLLIYLSPFHPAAEGEPPSLGDVLNTMPSQLQLADGEKLHVRDVISIVDHYMYTNHLGLINCIQILEGYTIFSHGDVKLYALLRTLNLQKLTQNYLPMILALQLEHPDQNTAFLIDLKGQGIDFWLDRVKENGMPASFTGATQSEREENYAGDLAAFINELK